MEGFLIVLGVIIGAILILYIDYYLANEFFKIVQMKGHNDKRYLWLCFGFGLIGYLMVIALPETQAAKKVGINTEDESLPTL